MIVKNLGGQTNTSLIGAYQSGIVMMKYNEIKTLALNEKQL